MRIRIIRYFFVRLYNFFLSLSEGAPKRILGKIITLYKKVFLRKVILKDFDSDIKILLNPNNSSGQQEYFLYYDTYDKSNFDFIKRYLKKGMVVVDIGANIGLYSMFFSKYVGENGKIISFEPFPVTYEHLLQNLKINNICNVTAYNYAISDRKESRVIYKDQYNDGANSLVFDENNNGNEKVTTLIFDDFWNETLSKLISDINLIKIDVEGWELFVLKGMIKTLNEKSPVILMGHNGFRYKQSSIEAYEFLAGLGYNCWEIHENKLRAVTESAIMNDYDDVFIDFCYSKRNITEFNEALFK